MILSRKQQYALSALSGLLLSLAWPVRGFPGLLFIGWVPLLWVESYLLENKDSYRRWAAFRPAFIAFGVWNILTTWWIWNSTPWGGVMAVFFNTLFMSVVFSLFHMSRRTIRKGKNFAWLIIPYWLAWEYLHLNWDLSWPWLNLGNGFASYVKWIQWYEYTGTLGGTLWVLAANLMIIRFIKHIKEKSATVTGLLIIGCIIAICIGAPLGWSFYRYNHYSEQGKNMEVVVVQPNIDPWTEQYTLPVNEVFRRNITQAENLIDEKVDLLVCPESALQESIWLNNPYNSISIQLLKDYVSRHPHLTLVMGASTFRYYNPGEKLPSSVRKFADGSGYYDAYNTAFIVDTSPNLGYYHKSKLVPGPEKLPLPALTRPFQEIAFNLGGTVGTLGISPERTVFRHAGTGAKFNAAICYESVYGEFMNGFIRNGSQLICVITNDGWWGHTAGHRQHMSFSSLRAIETRRCVARSANTGISCFVNQRGDILQPLPYWTSGAIRSTLYLNKELTFYVKYGDYLGRIASLITALFLLLTLTVALGGHREMKS
ncbi:MAG: apolipoprotein N-acyltransferase [Bacteroidales bacterium]|jgi:apolipoprotein N-acyltransferase|nr:apolipoprotein N-acyltransferase [Bacteroidales bacterium]NPV35979.1 apolipoprotein N-acyltransferase [Bacteroidales bacterium]